MDTIEWETHEYEFRHKTSDWYWAVGVITLSIAIAAVLYKNILFAIVVVVGGFVLAVHASKHSQIVHYELNRRGAAIGKTLYPFDSIETFWIEDRDDNPRILLKSKKFFMPYIIMPLGAVMPETAHAHLAHYLTEEEHVEPPFQKFMEYLGF